MTIKKSKLQTALNKIDPDLLVVGCGKWDKANLIVVASTVVGSYDSSYFLYNKNTEELEMIDPFKQMSKFIYANNHVVKLV